MIRLVENEAMLGLGLAGSICRPKMRLRGKMAFILLVLFFFFLLKSVYLARFRLRYIRA